MTKEDFASLLTEYGNLSFKCGNFDPDDVLEKYRVTPFRELAALRAAAKQAVLNAYNEVSDEEHRH